MTRLVNIKLNDSWIKETSKYLPRIDKSIEISEVLRSVFTENWIAENNQRCVDSPHASIAIRLASHANALFFNSSQPCIEVKRLWETGQFILVPLVVRYIFENWGAAHLSLNTLERLIKSGDIQQEEERTQRLTLGSRADVMLPWGGKSTKESYSTMKYVKSLEDCIDCSEIYDFLSEASHPNNLQNSYFQMAGPPMSNWENKKFNEHGHELLEKTVSIFELTCSGIQKDVARINNLGRELIESSDNKHA